GSEPRSPIGVFGVPQIAAVAIDSGERDRALRPEITLRGKIGAGHPVVAFGGAGLKVPTQAEVDSEFGSGAPIVLRIHCEILLRERGRHIGAWTDPPQAGAEQ